MLFSEIAYRQLYIVIRC